MSRKKQPAPQSKCTENCSYRSLYAGAQQSLSDMAQRQAEALSRATRLRNGILTTVKHLFPSKFYEAEKQMGGKLADSSDDVVLGYMKALIEQSVASGQVHGLVELRNALVSAGFPIPESSTNLEEWALTVKTTNVEPAVKDDSGFTDIFGGAGSNTFSDDIFPASAPVKKEKKSRKDKKRESVEKVDMSVFGGSPEAPAEETQVAPEPAVEETVEEVVVAPEAPIAEEVETVEEPTVETEEVSAEEASAEETEVNAETETAEPASPFEGEEMFTSPLDETEEPVQLTDDSFGDVFTSGAEALSDDGFGDLFPTAEPASDEGFGDVFNTLAEPTAGDDSFGDLFPADESSTESEVEEPAKEEKVEESPKTEEEVSPQKEEGSSTQTATPARALTAPLRPRPAQPASTGPVKQPKRRPVKQASGAPGEAAAEAAKENLTADVDATLTAAAESPRPMFISSLRALAEDEKVEAWEDTRMTELDSAFQFVPAQSRNRERGSLIIPKKAVADERSEVARSYWAECINTYRGVSLYEAGVLLSSVNDNIVSHRVSSETITLRLNDRRGLIAMVVVMGSDLEDNGSTRKSIVEQIEELSKERMSMIAVVAITEQTAGRLPDVLTSESVRRGWTPGMPIAVSKSWDWATNARSSMNIVISG